MAVRELCFSVANREGCRRQTAPLDTKSFEVEKKLGRGKKGKGKKGEKGRERERKEIGKKTERKKEERGRKKEK